MVISWLVSIGSLILLLLFQAHGIYGGDSGDLVTAAYTFGVPHPSGYPLYTFLGWLLTRLPFAGAAWQISLLSSIPHAVTVGLGAFLTVRLSKRPLAGVFAALVLLGTYAFFLYGVIQEVYALAALTVLSSLAALLFWQETRRSAWFLAAAFFFGVGLSHHHAMLFLPLVFWGWVQLSSRFGVSFPRITARSAAFAVACVLAGLMPYAYVLVAARGNSIINWDHATTISRFVRLFMLTDYGSFRGNVGLGEIPIQRFLGLKAYAQFLGDDLSAAGVLLLAAGYGFLFRTKRAAFWLFFLSAVFFGPVLYFYASFPIVSRFTIGTFEQFLVFSETLFAVVIGVGFHAVLIGISGVTRRMLRSTSLVPLVSLGSAAVLFAYPLTMAGVTLYRFWGFPQDRTAERLGRDIVGTAEENSILLLYGDTALFTSQYVRYVLGVGPNVIVLQGSRVGTPEYTDTMKAAFPALFYPQETGADFVREFLLGQPGYAVYSNAQIPVASGQYWVPFGLLYRLMPATRLPSIDELVARNNALWARYQQPGDGVLSRFNHLLLSDVRDVYAASRIAYGKTLVKAGRDKEAREQFLAALSYESDIYKADAHLFAGISEMSLGMCSEAKRSFDAARKADKSGMTQSLLYEAVLARDCIKDASAAASLFSEYERLRQQQEQSLESL